MSFSEIQTQTGMWQKRLQDTKARVALVRSALGLPPLQPNGGWSTGREASVGSPWATVPTVPDAGYATAYGRASATPKPPPGSSTQFASTSFRTGNNSPSLYGVVEGERDLKLSGVCMAAVPATSRTVFGTDPNNLTSGSLTGWTPWMPYAPFDPVACGVE